MSQNGSEHPAPEPARQINPSPVPFTTRVDVLPTAAGALLRVSFYTPTGQFVLIASAADWSQIAELIATNAAKAGRSLLLPPPGTVLPPLPE